MFGLFGRKYLKDDQCLLICLLINYMNNRLIVLVEDLLKNNCVNVCHVSIYDMYVTMNQ